MEDSKPSILDALAQVQRTVIVPKSRHNSFGNYDYRSYEDIVAALKKPCEDAGLVYFLTDEIVEVAGRVYVRAKCIAYLQADMNQTATAYGYARETEHKKGSDDAQVTGMASSYARKYALCGLFTIDGQADPDSMEPTTHTEAKEPPAEGPFVARCRSCGTRYTFNNAQEFEAFKASDKHCPHPDWVVE